ncbi:MAG: hypothetical protein LBC85_11995, partial [Fibromonadaceae bacterium]|nr:hypothetical protein [Fibromonadaceae bacterium]
MIVRKMLLMFITLLFGFFLVNCSNDSSSDDQNLVPGVSSDSQSNTSSDSQQSGTYLGYGYDVIQSSYINRVDVRMLHPVLDQKRMNNDGLIVSEQMGMQEFETFVGNSLTEFYSERNERIGLGLSASVPFKGVLFSGKFETEFGVQLNESRVDEHTYLRGRSYHYTHHEYIGHGRATAEKLVEYLTEGFVADLRSRTATQILDRYGSHIFIQYYKGGAMEYNYAYHGTELGSSTEELSTALRASLSVKSMAGASVGLSSDWQEREKQGWQELENNSTFRSRTYGGELVNVSSVGQIESNYTIWLNSIKDKADICGIGKFDESFISVWELAAASGELELAEELKNEFLKRAKEQEDNLWTMTRMVETGRFTTAGNHTYTLPNNVTYPATIEIYALGAGGGGQGGYEFHNMAASHEGTGAGGGGGSVAYTKFSVSQSTTFTITVGNGGAGGSDVFTPFNLLHARWQSGNPGVNGGNS